MKVEVITLLIRFAILIMTGVLIPAFKHWIDTKTENEKLNQVKAAAKTAVNAAEQMYKSMDPDGEIRKKLARETIERAAYRTGLILTDDEIRQIMEAAVMELNQVTHGGINNVKECN